MLKLFFSYRVDGVKRQKFNMGDIFFVISLKQARRLLKNGFSQPPCFYGTLLS